MHINITKGKRGAGFRVGTDSEVARHQTGKGYAASGLGVQQKVLRRTFWLRAWDECSVGICRVPTNTDLGRSIDHPPRNI